LEADPKDVQALRMKFRIDPVFCFVAAGVFVFDIATKWIAGVRLVPVGSIEIVPGYLDLTYIQNSGVAFGLLHGIRAVWKPYALSSVAVIAVAALFLYGSRISRSRLLLRVALGAATGGVLGNFLDRLLRGSVVDFIDLHFRSAFHWPAFNIADSAITIGVVLMLLDAIKQSPVASRQQPVNGKQ
jgi:signal peptidase II